MIHVGLRHQQREVFALQRGKDFRQPFGRLVEQQASGADATSRKAN
jgi:hypothetical protein